MKKLNIITLVLSIILTVFSCSKDDMLVGSNNIISEFRDVAPFSKVSSEGSFTVNIMQGSPQSLEVSANDNIMNNLKTTVSNNTLRIYVLDGSYSNTQVEVTITVPNLNALQNSGSGDISMLGLDSQGNMEIENTGSGDISVLELNSQDNVKVENHGSGNIYVPELNSLGNIQVKNTASGDISISGSVNNLDIRNEGSGTFNGSQFMSTNTGVENYGSGDCKVYSTEVLNVKIEGSGDVYYTGNPMINTNISGSGNLIDAN